MTRKQFFASAVALIGVTAPTAAALTERRLVDVSDAITGEGFVCPTVVTLDGEDVSSRCYRVEKYSDGTGLVWLYRVNREGQLYIAFDCVAREPCPRSGAVEIRRP